MKRIFYAVVITISIVLPAKAQDVVAADEGVSGNIGAGVGLEYGGLGIRLSGPVTKHFSLLGGVGYNFLDVGVTGGVSYEPLLRGNLRPEIIALVGANAVITDNGDLHPRFNRTYYGPSLGAGIHYHIGPNENFINIKAIFPFTTTAYQDAIDDGKNVKTIPFYVSVGFHIDLGK